MPYYLLHESAVCNIPCRIVWICDKNISVSSVSISIKASSRAAGENHSAHPAWNIRYHSRLHEAHAHSRKSPGPEALLLGLYGMSYRHKKLWSSVSGNYILALYAAALLCEILWYRFLRPLHAMSGYLSACESASLIASLTECGMPRGLIFTENPYLLYCCICHRHGCFSFKSSINSYINSSIFKAILKQDS